MLHQSETVTVESSRSDGRNILQRWTQSIVSVTKFICSHPSIEGGERAGALRLADTEAFERPGER